MEKIAKAIVDAAVRQLDDMKIRAECSMKEAAAIVDRAKADLTLAGLALSEGAAKPFLGSAAMLVGSSDSTFYTGGSVPRLTIENRNGGGGPLAELHGDPEFLKKMQGRYKALVFLYKID